MVGTISFMACVVMMLARHASAYDKPLAWIVLLCIADFTERGGVSFDRADVQDDDIRIPIGCERRAGLCKKPLHRLAFADVCRASEALDEDFGHGMPVTAAI